METADRITKAVTLYSAVALHLLTLRDMAHVGSVLGKNKVNIASFSLGRSDRPASDGQPLIAIAVVETDETVNLRLTDPTGGATIGSIGSSLLTIVNDDTNVIQASGSALIAESGPVNLTIDPGETVTLRHSILNTGTGNYHKRPGGF